MKERHLMSFKDFSSSTDTTKPNTPSVAVKPDQSDKKPVAETPVKKT